MAYSYHETTPMDVARIMKGDDLRALRAIRDIYGDSTDDVLNALHSMAARIAIACGCDPKAFAEGMQHHWQAVVEHLDAYRKN